MGLPGAVPLPSLPVCRGPAAADRDSRARIGARAVLLYASADAVRGAWQPEKGLGFAERRALARCSSGGPMGLPGAVPLPSRPVPVRPVLGPEYFGSFESCPDFRGSESVETDNFHLPGRSGPFDDEVVDPAVDLTNEAQSAVQCVPRDLAKRLGAENEIGALDDLRKAPIVVQSEFRMTGDGQAGVATVLFVHDAVGEMNEKSTRPDPFTHLRVQHTDGQVPSGAGPEVAEDRRIQDGADRATGRVVVGAVDPLVQVFQEDLIRVSSGVRSPIRAGAFVHDPDAGSAVYPFRGFLGEG